MTLSEIEIKIELRCNVCNDVIVKEECNVWCKAERYLLIIVLDSALF